MRVQNFESVLSYIEFWLQLGPAFADILFLSGCVLSPLLWAFIPEFSAAALA